MAFEDKNKGKWNNTYNNYNAPSLPSGYLNNGYLTKDGKRDKRYIGEYAVQIGKVLSADQNTGKSKIRSFFDTSLSIKSAVYNKAISEDEAMVQLMQLKNRVVDRESKGNASKYFVEFISKNVDMVVSEDDKFRERIRHFCEHFEAVICHTADKRSRK